MDTGNGGPGDAADARARGGVEEPDGFDAVDDAIADIAAGKAVVVVDDANRENEGDLIFAAAKATPELLAFMIRYTSGVICVPMLPDRLDRLQIPLMTSQNHDRMRTAYTISVDARDGVSTGISAADRARTIRLLADEGTEPHDFVRPGHIFPLRYKDGGVLARRGHTEAAVDLARLAGLPEAGVLAEIVNDDGTMSRLPRLKVFAREHGLKLISVAQLVEYRKRTERMVRRVTETRLPNRYGMWRVIGYASAIDGGEHLALTYGDVGDGHDVLVRVHSECLTGDVLGSLRCDCGAQLDAAMAAIAAERRGVVLYLRGHEGRGIGLMQKLRAYHLQDNGSDTVDANLELGLPADAREYGNAAQMLVDLGVRSIRMLTNNPAKLRGIEGYGIQVTGRVPMTVDVNAYNHRYLAAKRDRLGHDIGGLDAPAPGRPLPAPRGEAGAVDHAVPRDAAQPEAAPREAVRPEVVRPEAVTGEAAPRDPAPAPVSACRELP
jgi:3,4-dihydroxy 2-butanone 4-phosphate synthase / GTP cyclohydrolase II